MIRAADATVAREGDTLRFAGALVRAHIAGAWQQVPAALDGVRAFDLSAVERVDSAGLALLSLLAARCEGVALRGDPQGLDALRDAYRLARGSLAFANGA